MRLRAVQPKYQPSRDSQEGLTPIPECKTFGVNPAEAERGFTVIEMLVVIAIMGIMLGLFMVNFGTERSSRNLRIAQNELITHLRKVQGYALSSRNLDGVTPVQFYIVKFDRNRPDQYEIQAVYDYLKTNPPKLRSIETVKLPKGLTISSLAINNRPEAPPSYSPLCMLLVFKVPFGDVLMNNGCEFDESNPFRSNPFPPDDYYRVVNFNQDVANEPTSSNSNFTIVIRDPANDNAATNHRDVTVRGVSGKITAE